MAILKIDRTTPFNPANFLGKGWGVWRGSADGNGLEGDEDQDERSLALTEVDLAHVRLDDCLGEGEKQISGEEKLCRLKKTGCIRLDAKVFQTLWENQCLIPERWKEKTDGCTTYVFFGGTTLRSPGGHRDVLCLYWSDGGWYWRYCWLENDWVANSPSAVLVAG